MQDGFQTAVVIPAHNAAGTIAACVQACAAQTRPPARILVVDDGSTDDTAALAETAGAEVLRQEQRGPAAARNAGAAQLDVDIVAFTDADCVPRPDWLERLLEGFDADDVAGAGGTYAIANPDRLLARMVQLEIDERHARFGREVDFLGSFNVAYRLAAFRAVGGFDEQFRCASAEDNDLAYRLVDSGGRLRFVPGAVVAHYHPERLGRYLRTQARHGFWRVKLYAKHPHRTARGDRYAGVLDLAAPGLSLLFLALVAMLAVARWLPPYVKLAHLAALFAVALVYLAIRIPPAVQMAVRGGSMRYLEFGDLAALRDVARGLGMLAGVWTFLIRRKETA